MRFVIEIIKALLQRVEQHQLNLIAGSLAYFFFLAIFPLLIFLNALLGHFGFALYDVVASLSSIIPTTISDVLNAYIDLISSNDSATLISFGLLGTLYSASIAVTSIIHAILRAYNQNNHRSWIKSKGIAIGFTLLIGLTLTLSLFLPLLGQVFLNLLNQYVQIPAWSWVVLNIVRWILTPIMIMLTLALLYKVIPYTPYKQSIWPGAVFATLIWMGASYVFSIYVNQFANYSTVYGSIGAIIALLIWFFLTGLSMILGAELNDILDQRKLK